MNEIDWSKAPEGAIGRGNIGISHFYVWFSEKWYEYVDSNHGGRHYFGDTCVYSEKDIVSRTHRPTTQSWSGEGLPPVGAVCEYNPMPVGKPKKWHKVEVVYASEWVIVMRCIEAPSGHEGGNGVEIAMAVDSCSLEDIRPIRTPEQIAADEREAAIERACADIEKRIEGFNVQLSYSLAIRATIEAMIDKGYRKP